MTSYEFIWSINNYYANIKSETYMQNLKLSAQSIINLTLHAQYTIAE